MKIESTDIVQLVDLAIREYADKHNTPVIAVSYDGDNKSCEVIIDVEAPSSHSKSVARQSFIISSETVKEIPYEPGDDQTEAS
jgi:hypothetical protein